MAWWKQARRRKLGRYIDYPKKFILLRWMIDGETLGSDFFIEKYGGNGGALINFQGGFGYDRTVRKMIQDKEVTISRGIHHGASRAFGGYPSINATRLQITQKGREEYERLKKRYAK